MEQERKFLHDLATPLVRAKLLATKLLGQLEGTRALKTPTEPVDVIKLILQSIFEMEQMHARQKEYLYDKERV